MSTKAAVLAIVLFTRS